MKKWIQKKEVCRFWEVWKNLKKKKGGPKAEPKKGGLEKKNDFFSRKYWLLYRLDDTNSRWKNHKLAS